MIEKDRTLATQVRDRARRHFDEAASRWRGGFPNPSEPADAILADALIVLARQPKYDALVDAVRMFDVITTDEYFNNTVVAVAAHEMHKALAALDREDS